MVKRIANEIQNGKEKKIKIDPAINQTIYIKNLNDKINPILLKTNLYMLCSSYGDIIDVIIKPKSRKMRGQAHIIFSNLIEAQVAHNSLQDFDFFDKKMVVQYAKRKSRKIKIEDDNIFNE